MTTRVHGLFRFKFVADTPDGGNSPVLVIVDFFTQTLDMYINGSCITNVFISPDLVKKLFTGNYMVGRRRKSV